MILWFMLRMYSPMMPRKISCTAPRKNMPMTMGAVPATKSFQLHSFRIR